MIVKKYGGSSLITLEQIEYIASHLPDEPHVLVLSARGNQTDQIHRVASRFRDADREAINNYIALGEINSCSLMHMVLSSLAKKSVVLDYVQTGLKASKLYEGDIIGCDPSFIESSLDSGNIVIVPGYQANYDGKLAILKRGASDDTAVAIASVLKLPCEVSSNIHSIYDHEGNTIDYVDYNTLLTLINSDNAPMSMSSILLAESLDVEISFKHWQSQQRGTLICSRENKDALMRHYKAQMAEC